MGPTCTYEEGYDQDTGEEHDFLEIAFSAYQMVITRQDDCPVARVSRAPEHGTDDGWWPTGYGGRIDIANPDSVRKLPQEFWPSGLGKL
jgi:hypothetical protein